MNDNLVVGKITQLSGNENLQLINKGLKDLGKLEEGKVKKGGINSQPSIPRPTEEPKGQSPKKEKKYSLSDIKLLNQRLNSQSKRIRNLQKKLTQILSNQKHYLKIRLPDVLKREKRKVEFSQELQKAKRVLKTFGKNTFSFLSKSKDINKRNERHIGLFTYIEMQRLRQFLKTSHSQDYVLYKHQKGILKDRHLIFFTENEIKKLRNLLQKKEK